jgi:hypothetical protein
VVNTITANLWRLDGYYSFDDLYQEAYVLFLELSHVYADSVDNAKWFMSLFSTSYVRRIHTLSTKAYRTRGMVRDSDFAANESDESFLESIVGDLQNDGELEAHLERMPSEVSQVVQLLLNAPREILDLAESAWRSSGRKKVYGNQFLCSLLGKNPKHVDLVGAVKRFFSNAV